MDIADINDVFEKVKAEDARFRYVIDMKSLKNKRGDLSPETVENPVRGEVVG